MVCSSEEPEILHSRVNRAFDGYYSPAVNLIIVQQAHHVKVFL